MVITCTHTPQHSGSARRQCIGRTGEEIAAQYLRSCGFRVLERNWRSRYGELDIIAQDGDTVVAVEVKTRAGNGYGSGFEAITHTKARRLRRLFLLWLRTFSPNCARLRIDAIAICLQAEGRPRIEHLRGIV